MWSQYTARVLGLFASYLFITSAPASAKAFPNQDGVVLKPIKPEVVAPEAVLRARSTPDFSSLALAKEARLLFGSDEENGQAHMASMTLRAPNGLRVIMMEVFEPLTSAVDCQGDDGTMSLTFKTEAALDYAWKEWAWINQDANHTFIMVANHDGCGPDEERQAYTISQVDREAGSLKTLLKARVAPWDEVAGSFDLEFGHMPPEVVRRRRLSRRQTPKDALNKVGDPGIFPDLDDLEGSLNRENSSIFPLDAGTPGQRSNLFATPDFVDQLRAQVDCIDCYIAGKLNVTGRVSVENFIPVKVTVEASPLNITAALGLEASFTAKANGPAKQEYKGSKNLASSIIPGAGFQILGIFKVGIILGLSVEGEISISGSGNFSVGLTTSLSDSARIAVDMLNPNASTQTGLDFRPDGKGQVNSLNGTVEIKAAAKPKLSFGVQILKDTTLEAFFALSLPEVSATADSIYNRAGACATTPGSSRYGAQLGSKVSIGLSVGGEATVNDKGVEYEKSLYTAVEKELFNKCYPLTAIKDEVPSEEAGAGGNQTTPSSSASGQNPASTTRASAASFDRGTPGWMLFLLLASLYVLV